MLAKISAALGAVGSIPYAALVVFEARRIGAEGSDVALLTGVLLLLAAAAAGAGWWWGEAGVHGVAVLVWLLLVLGFAVALTDVTDGGGGWDLSRYLFVGFFFYVWLIVPTVCAPAFFAWAASHANPRRWRAARAARALKREWTRAQSDDIFARLERTRTAGAPGAETPHPPENPLASPRPIVE